MLKRSRFKRGPLSWHGILAVCLVFLTVTVVTLIVAFILITWLAPIHPA